MGGGPPSLKDLSQGKLAHETPVPATPEPVDPAKVAADSLAVQLKYAPDVYNANATYQPKYAALDQNLLNDSLFGGNGAPGLIDMYGKAGTSLSSQDAAANTAQRTADINDVNNLGGLARQAYNNANPDLMKTMGGLSDYVQSLRSANLPGAVPAFAGAGNIGDVTNASAGRMGRTSTYGATNLTATGAANSALAPQLTADAANYAQKTPLQAQLEAQAAEGLANGGSLTASEQSKAQQDVRSAYAARGLNDSNGAIGAEILNTDAARTAKMNAARTFAANTDAAGNATLQANRNFATGMSDSLLGNNEFNANALNTAAAQNASAANAAAAANAGAKNTSMLTQYGTNADTSKTNAGAANQFALTQYGTNADLSRSNSALSLQAQLANMDYTRANTNDQVSREMQLAGLQQSQAQDPFQMVLGRSGVPGQAQSAASAAGYTQGAAPKLFDPFNSAITQIYAGNNANATASSIAAGNNQSQQNSAMMGTAGTLLLAL